jgi:DNA-binding NtrC family response regulator
MQIESRPSGTVLVIDDDPDMRRLLKDFLELDGLRVVEAADGGHAIFLVESEPIHVVILDKEMPGMNGLDVLSLLQERWPSIPIIFVTAFGGPDVAEESRRRGARYYVEKPFRVGRILETVQAVIQGGP